MHRSIHSVPCTALNAEKTMVKWETSPLPSRSLHSRREDIQQIIQEIASVVSGMMKTKQSIGKRSLVCGGRGSFRYNIRGRFSEVMFAPSLEWEGASCVLIWGPEKGMSSECLRNRKETHVAGAERIMGRRSERKGRARSGRGLYPQI